MPLHADGECRRPDHRNRLDGAVGSDRFDLQPFAETAEHRSRTNPQIGADPAYNAKLYENMLAARPK